MYGMVNQAIKDMVIDSHDTNFWNELVLQSGIEHSDFQPFVQYGDDITLGIVATYCEMSGQDASSVLYNFGRFWIDYARESEYSGILNLFGGDPVRLLESLNQLHARIMITFSGLNAPTFDIEKINQNEVNVLYKSSRDMPLIPFVEGLIFAIFEMYDQRCEIKAEAINGDGCSAVFKVSF